MPKKKRTRKSRVSSPLTRFFGVLTCAASLYFIVSLLTYNSTDPSFNSSTAEETTNAGGYLGALSADLLLQLLGLAALFAVTVPLFWGWKKVVDRPVSNLWLRLTTLLVGLVLMSSFLAGFTPFPSWPIESGLGGSIGAVIYNLAPEIVGNGLFMALLLASAMLFLMQSTSMSIGEWRGLNRVAMQVVMVVYAIFSSLLPRRFFQRSEDEEYEEDEEYDEEYEDEEYAEEEYDDEEEEEGEEEDATLLDRIKYTLSNVLFFWRRNDDEEEEDEEEYEDEDEYDDEEYDEYDDEMEEEEPVDNRRKGRRSTRKSARSTRSAQSSLALPHGDYALPAVSLLKSPGKSKSRGQSAASLQQNARLLESVLQDFGVNGEITEINPGPVVTLYELEPSPGTKSSRVIGLSDDIARSMSAISARIAVIPGRNAIGIELPNSTRETVYLRSMLESENYETTETHLPLALGKDIGGAPVIVDLARMPHLLVAGTTGSGKSVAINTMIMSLVYRLSPEECKFIMIDPKMLELSIYDGIPHLLTPVVTEPGKAVVALKWTVREMENRYRMMANLGVRNIDGYNKQIREAKAKGKELTRRVQTGFDDETGEPIMEQVAIDMVELPYIVVVVDEMADLMLTAGKDIEASIQRLAQMARAAGIHLIMATQRPSVDVITGVVKANFPTRISFQVTSRIDSRTILGEQGAEQLLGQGDMLYMAGGGRITRVHGPFVSDEEVEDVVTHLKDQGMPTYIEDVTREDPLDEFDDDVGERDELYDKAVAIVLRDRKASTSYVQRSLKIGYNRAANIIDHMERAGLISEANHVGKREVLAEEA